MTVSSSAEHWNVRYRQTESVWSLEPNQFVVESFNGYPPGKMLDLGGGEGRNALWFASQGWEVENSDFSEVAVEKFLRRADEAGFREQCTGTVAPAGSLTACVTAPVDLVVVAYLQLNHNELSAAISVAAHSLRSGGEFFGVWHARENIERGFGGPPDPMVNPTHDELRLSLREADLSEDSIELRERIVDADGSQRIALDVVVRAHRI